MNVEQGGTAEPLVQTPSPEASLPSSRGVNKGNWRRRGDGHGRPVVRGPSLASRETSAGQYWSSDVVVSSGE